MTVYGSKDTNGTHQTMVNGQVTKYDYKWTFDKDFTITGERATALNAKDATVNQNSGLDWLLIIGLIVIILLLIALIFLFIKRRKKEEQEDKTNEDEDKSI